MIYIAVNCTGRQRAGIDDITGSFCLKFLSIRLRAIFNDTNQPGLALVAFICWNLLV